MNFVSPKSEKIKFIDDCKILELSASSRISSLASLAIVAIYFFSVSREIPISFFQGLACILLVTALCLRLRHSYKTQSAKWLTEFSVYSSLVAMGWSLSFVTTFIEAEGNVKILIITFSIITGLISAAVYSLAISRRDFVTFVVCALVPLYYKFNDPNFDSSFQFSGNLITTAFIIFLIRQQRQVEDSWFHQRIVNFELEKLMNLFPGGVAVVRNGLFSKTNHYFDSFLNLMNVHQPATELIKKMTDISMQKKASREQIQIDLPVNDQIRAHFVSIENTDFINNHETIVTLVDIEDYKRIEKDNLVHRAKLEQSSKMAALGVMSSGMAHEINNPLAIILARVQLMQMQIQNTNKDLDRNQLEKSIEIVGSTVKRISKIIKGLRSFARESSNDPFEKVLLSEVVEATLSFCETKIENSQARFENKMDPNIQILCRPAEISQVLLNAISNSLYVVSSLEEKWIHLEAEIEGEEVVIKVTDSGSGIDPQLRSKIMIPFFTTKEVGSGTGLGLSLSKGIIESHGGKFYFNHDHPNTQLVIRLPNCNAQVNILSG